MASVTRLLPMILSLTTLASAIPKSSTSYKSQQYLATFDNLVENATPDLSPITDYMGLHYLGFELIGNPSAAENALVLTPPSPPNTAASGPTAQTLYGGPPEINTNTATHNITYFDAISLYFACLINAEAATPDSEECRVLFSGTYYGGGNVTVDQQASFVPSLTPPSRFQQIVFDSNFFRGLKSLTLSVIVEPTTPTTTALIIDSFAYKGYSPS